MTEKALNRSTSQSSITLLQWEQSFCWCIVTSKPFSVEILPLHMKEVWAIRDPQQLVWKGHTSGSDTLQLHILPPWSLRVCVSVIMLVCAHICVLPMWVVEAEDWTQPHGSELTLVIADSVYCGERMASCDSRLTNRFWSINRVRLWAVMSGGMSGHRLSRGKKSNHDWH